jgi:hypothetical protein
MKIFTIQEANKLLSEIGRTIERLRKSYTASSKMRVDAGLAAAAAGDGGGGMAGGSQYVQFLFETSEISVELSDFGVQIKDPERGLIDFPCLRNGKVVLLCWQLGEREEIEWWHDVEAGFAGRQRL